MLLKIYLEMGALVSLQYLMDIEGNHVLNLFQPIYLRYELMVKDNL